jgi:hypothetical protein
MAVEEVTIEFQWTRSEYLHVVGKGVVARQVRGTFLASFACAIGGVGVVYSGHLGNGFFFIGLGIAYFGLGLWLRYAIPRRGWNKGLDVRDPIRITFSDDGIATKASTSEGKVSWLSYPYSREWSDYYFLQRRRRAAPGKIIPKRAFKSPRDESSLRAMLKSHTKPNLRPSTDLDGF